MTINLTVGNWIDVNVGAGWAHVTGAGTGTLGCFAFKDGATVLLSCSHVLFPDYLAPEGLSVYSPSWSSCCCGGDKLADVIFDPKQEASTHTLEFPTDGYTDGKWYGGFQSAVGLGFIFAGAGMTKSRQALNFLTDCAIASVDTKNVRALNIWVDPRDPTNTIWLRGVPSEGLGIKPGPPLGVRPDDSMYVRIIVPRDGGRVIHGTMMKFNWTDGEHTDDLGRSPANVDDLLYLYPIGFAQGFKVRKKKGEKEARALSRQFIILPRPPPSQLGANEDETLANFRKSYDGNTKLGFERGDSGAIVINSKEEVIAMVSRMISFERLAEYEGKALTERQKDDASATGAFLLSRSVMEFAQVSNFGIATPIQAIVDHLGIVIPLNPFSFPAPTPNEGSPPTAPEDRAGVARLRDRLRASRRGLVFLELVTRHRREVNRLFATVRAIHAAWRALQGPAFLLHVQRAIREPAHVVPSSINGVSRERLATAMFELFAHHGSPELRRDLVRQRQRALDLLPAIATLDDLPTMIARRATTIARRLG